MRFKFQDTVEASGRVDGALVLGFNGINEVDGVVFLEVLDTKVVDAESEGCFAGRVAPEVGSKFHGFISEWGKFLNKLYKFNDSGFF